MVAPPIRPFRGASRKGACENIRFSISLFAAGDFSRETSPAVKGEEKRTFSQAKNLPTEHRIQTNQWSVSFAVLLSPGMKGNQNLRVTRLRLHCDSIWEIEQHPPILESSLGVFVGVLSSWIWDVARTYFKPDLGSFYISIASVAGVWKGREREF